MKRIGIITALLREASCLPVVSPTPAQIHDIDNLTALFICGMGAKRAALAAEKMVAQGCDGLISWGTCGGLATGLQPGDLIIPDKIVSAADHYHTDQAWRKAVIDRIFNHCPGKIHLGAITDSQEVIADQTRKRSLRNLSEAHAVDMESAAIAAVAAQREIPFIAVRAVSDSATMPVPEMIAQFTDPFGRVRGAALLTALLRNSRQIPTLIKLGLGFKAASATLKWIGHRYGEILHPK